LKVNNRIVIITSQSIFILDKRFQFVKRELIRDLSDVILIKTNASIFSLNFVSGPPLLFQTFRRTELTVYLLTQGENMKKKANILRSKGLKITLKSGKSQQLYFDKQDTLKTSDSYQTKLLRNL
jgi:predicted ribosome-associated RNA-binding protein Tma20